jgi:hypothetical protein
MSNTIEAMKPATEDLLDRAAGLLSTLGQRHGLSNFRHAGRGRVVADAEPERTYLDVAEFELAAEGMLQARLTVITSGALSATAAAGRAVATTVTSD